MRDSVTAGRQLAAILMLSALACSASSRAPQPADTTFAAIQHRGQLVMGVDQYTSTHLFDKTADGGRIELQRDTDDPEGVATIRRHLRQVAAEFASGDFSASRAVHDSEIPGADVMAAKRAAITYSVTDLPRGAEMHIRTSDPAAVTAIHRFVDFQRSDHRAGGEDEHADHW